MKIDFEEMYSEILYLQGYISGMGKQADDTAKHYASRLAGQVNYLKEHQKKEKGELDR